MTSDEQVNHQVEFSKNLKVMIDENPLDYDLKMNILAAHIQRLICDKAQNKASIASLLVAEFNAKVVIKVANITKLAEGIY